MIFDPAGGHSHNGTDSHPVPVAGDASGDNTALVVTGLYELPITEPTSGDDGQFLRFNNGVGYSWAAPSSAITVKEDGSPVDAAASVLDFGSGFAVSSSPAGEANVGLNLSEVGGGGDLSWSTNTPTVTGLRGLTVAAPGAGDDAQYLRYNHSSGFSWETPPGTGISGITVQEGDSTVDAAATTLDFGAGFDVTSSPAGEANISLDLSEAVTGDVSFSANAGTVTAIRGHNIPAPGASEDEKFLKYDHDTTAYVWALPGLTITVQEGDSTVDASVSTLDFGPGFDVTSSPSGEANVSLDLSEVVTGDVSFTGNAALVVKANGITLPSPGGGDDGKLLTYVHGSTAYQLTAVNAVATASAAIQGWRRNAIMNAGTSKTQMKGLEDLETGITMFKSGTIVGAAVDAESDISNSGSDWYEVEVYKRTPSVSLTWTATGVTARITGSVGSGDLSAYGTGTATFSAGDQLTMFDQRNNLGASGVGVKGTLFVVMDN